MQPSKLLKNQRNKPYYRSPFNTSSFAFTSLELYPQRRQTEFYHRAAVPEEFQSRSFEHPQILDSPGPIWLEEEQRKERIIPPQHSDMKAIRDSYFS